jgi:hypothetical protein
LRHCSLLLQVHPTQHCIQDAQHKSFFR